MDQSSSVVLKNKSSKLFGKGILISQIGLAIALLIVSFTNSDVSFIATKPKPFIGECILIGLSAVLSTLLISHYRGGVSKKTVDGIFITFLVFFILHMLMEMSGINNIGSEDEHLGDERQQAWIDKHVFNNYMYGFLGIGTIIMGIVSMRVGGLSDRVSAKGWANLLEECGLFALVNGMPAYVIAKDRGCKSASRTTAKNVGMYAVLYMLLENGGFFNNLLT